MTASDPDGPATSGLPMRFGHVILRIVTLLVGVHLYLASSNATFICGFESQEAQQGYGSASCHRLSVSLMATAALIMRAHSRKKRVL